MLVEAGGEEAAEMLEELVELFEDEGKAKLPRMHGLLTEGNLPDLRRDAHAIAGASANLGGRRLNRIAKTVELQALNGQAEGLDVGITTLHETFFATGAALHARIASLRAS